MTYQAQGTFSLFPCKQLLRTIGFNHDTMHVWIMGAIDTNRTLIATKAARMRYVSW